MADNELVPMPNVEIVRASEVPTLLGQIRPVWQAKSLIDRVNRLLYVDPSSACQRLFNAAIHDLREKVILAGIDIARDAAAQHKLPPVSRPEDIENYSVAKLIDLAYRIGLLTRPEWRRISRCYEIRRDLEHEDDEYEAGVEDCIYIFKTCIEVVLAKDPVHLLRVTDVKAAIEEAVPSTPAASLLADFERAPQPRQEEILKMLSGIALDSSQSDIVRQNAFTFMQNFQPRIHNQVRLELAKHIQDQVDRRGFTNAYARVANAMGVLPYLRQALIADLFESVYHQMERVGYSWRGHTQHGEIIRSLNEVGGLRTCPPTQRSKILKWMVLAYLGEPGGLTSYGNIRNVFYSNTAAPLVYDAIKENSDLVGDELRSLREEATIKRKCSDQHIARRFESLLDLVETKEKDTAA